MIGLFRALGSAVVIGVGVKAGGEIYSVLRRRVFGEEDAAADAASPVDEILSADDDDEAKETRLKEERARINRELDRLRRGRATH